MNMKRINYQHLFYFWNVVREESITRACEKLHLAQPTISGQLAVFEQTIGEKLFHRNGRKLVLTDTGRIVYHYAEEIFSIGRELANTLNGRIAGGGMRLTVGVTDALPKLAVYRLLAPAFSIPEPVQIICFADKAERLLNETALLSVDLILSDTPLMSASSSKAFNHLLGESGITVFGTEQHARTYKANFPRSLSGAPFLLPTNNTALRRALDQWFESEAITPIVRAEIEDSALIKTFGAGGVGLFVAPCSLESEVQKQYGVEIIGRIDSVHERFYAITLRRKLNHPAVTAILNNANNRLF